MVRPAPIAAGLGVGVLALVGLVTTGYYPPSVGPVPASVARGVVAGLLAGLAAGTVVGPDVRSGAVHGTLVAALGLSGIGVAYLALDAGWGPMLVAGFLLVSAVPAAVSVVPGSVAAAGLRARVVRT